MRGQTTPPPTTPGPAPGQPDPEHDAFPDMLAAVHRRFAARPAGPLLLTSPVGLWAAYLDALPPEQRQHYNCHACRRFVEHFGAAVTVDDAGHRVSAMWSASLAPAGYERLYATLAEQVESAPAEVFSYQGRNDMEIISMADIPAAAERIQRYRGIHPDDIR